MAATWRLESHIKLLYCLHLITLWAVIFCFSYVYFCLALKAQISSDQETSETRHRPFQPEKPEILTPAVNLESATRTKRNPTALPNWMGSRYGNGAEPPDNSYQYSLKELLQMENEKPKSKEKSKRKRIKLKILFNETSELNKQTPMLSEVENPAVINLPPLSEDDTKRTHVTNDGENEAWVVIPMFSKIQMNYLKEFCFTLNDFCAQTDGDYSKFNNQEKSTKENLVKEFTGEPDGEMLNVSNEISALENRGCYIHQFGKHIEVGYRKMFYGAWMRDPKPRSEEDDQKRWVVEHFSGIYLLEYGSESDLYKPELNPVKSYMLPFMYEGTSHVMYNGAFYYQRSATPNIVRYVLHTNRTKEVVIPGAAHKESNYLYADNDMTYFDLAVDENGLWVIYRKEGEKNVLYVTRLHPHSLHVIRTWNVTELETQAIGNAWVTCGVLYMVKNSREQNSTLYYAYDLYKHRYAPMSKMDWINVYGNANMITYNSLDKKIYIYDNGHLILLPVMLTYHVE